MKDRGEKQLKPSATQIISQWRQVQCEKGISAERSMADIFTEVYEKNIWKGNEEEGGYATLNPDAAYTQKYIELIRKFLKERKIKHVVDLGCGNFTLSRQFLVPGIRYTGIEVVPRLVEFLRENYAGDEIGFECLDITENDLPDGEVCLIKEVLQHFSNAEILNVLRKCKKYKYTIVTDAVPHPQKFPEVIVNLDISHGPLTRYHFNSALFFDKPPFNLTKIETLAETDFIGEIIFKTYLIRIPENF
jgi:SAM-dependent methyltransferase